MRALSALSLLFTSLLAAQTTAVDLRDEPHHSLEFQNDYVRVYRVAIPPRESVAAVTHAHDYLTIQLGRPPESPPDRLVSSLTPPPIPVPTAPISLGRADAQTPAYLNTSNAEVASLVVELLQDPESKGDHPPISLPGLPLSWDAGHGVHGAYWYQSLTGKNWGWETTVQPGATYRPGASCSPRHLLLIADTPLDVHMLTPGDLIISVDHGQQLWIDRAQTFEIRNDGTQPLHFFVVSFADHNC